MLSPPPFRLLDDEELAIEVFGRTGVVAVFTIRANVVDAVHPDAVDLDFDGPMTWYT